MTDPELKRFIGPGDAQVEELPRGLHEWISRAGLTATEQIILVRVTMAAGKGHAFHCHPPMEEIVYVLSGQAEQWVERDCRILGPGEAVHIPKDVVHATHNAGDAELVFLAILSPANAEGPGMIDVSGEEPWASLRGKTIH
ncbi:MAG: cupin domain-containing protein [Caldilineales bacterium]|nr:cupin domain-containing protein [Caldilineales bacterium]